MKYFARWLEKPLQSPTSRGKVRLLFGARQTGKSTLLRSIVPAGARVIDLARPEERLRYEREPGILTRELEATQGRKVFVCIDEIQKVPTLFDEVQSLYDRAGRRFELFLTGSSAHGLRSRAANLLPGRAHTYRLLPVLAPECGGPSASSILPLPMAAEARPRFPNSSIEDRLLWGALPGIITEPASRRAATLNAYVELYLEEEIRREAVVRDLGAFARFLEIAAAESGGVMNLTGLSQESGVPIATLRNYYGVLVDTFVGYWLEPYSHSPRKRLLSTPRFLFFDTGVRNAAARLPLHRTLLKTQAGPLFEQWVVLELLHRATYLGRTHRVSFWRTRHGAEVDAVVETPRRDIPVEVKWTENPRPTDARHVELFLDAHPKRSKAGFVVCRCPRPLQLTDRVTAIPWQLL